MIIRRVGPLSLAKILGALYFIMGFIFGLLISAFSVFSSAFSHASSGGGGKMFPVLFGGFAVIALPLFYGTMGFIGGLLSAFLYNLLAGWFGGIELEIETGAQTATVAAPPEPTAPVAEPGV